MPFLSATNGKKKSGFFEKYPSFCYLCMYIQNCGLRPSQCHTESKTTLIYVQMVRLQGFINILDIHSV